MTKYAQDKELLNLTAWKQAKKFVKNNKTFQRMMRQMNKKKRKKIYSDLPNSLSATNDKILEMSVFKIPATNENIAKVKAFRNFLFSKVSEWKF